MRNSQRHNPSGSGDNDQGRKKEFNAKVFWRLLSGLKKHFLWVALALSALVASTLGDLMIPVIIQRTLDENILANYLYLDQEALDFLQSEGFELEGIDTSSKAGTGGLLPLDGNWETIPVPLKEQLYNFSGTRGPGIRTQNPGNYDGPTLFRGEDWMLLSQETFDSLDGETRLSLRSRDLQTIFDQSLLMGAILLAVLLFSFVQVLVLTWISQLVMKDLRLQVFGHFLGQSMRYHNNTPQGKMVGGVTNDVATISDFFNTLFTGLLKDIIMMVGAVATLFFLDFTLALYTMIAIPPVVVLLVIFRTLSRRAHRLVRKDVSKVNTYLSEHLSGMKVVQMFGRESASQKEFSETNNNLRDSYLKERSIVAVFRPLTDFLSSVAIGILIYAGGYLLSLELMSIGILIAFINLVEKFFRPLNNIAESFTTLQSALAGAERVFGFLDQKEIIPNQGHALLTEDSKTDIRFDQVNFSYKEDEPVLRKVSFEIKQNQVVALVGYTGSGKTTITNLLTRFWDPQKGRITLGGIELRDYNLKSLRSSVQSVLQDVILFSGSILDNIALGRDIPEEKVIEVCKKVRAHDFVMRLPKGYQTVLEEGASNLSAGQRQLLSFARVLLQDPAILLLDEATANIDSETEALIQEALEVLLADRTVLVVAHRLSTIKKADKILVLDKGEIIEEGNHDELMAQKGFYHELYQIQLEEGELVG
jgi:ATP-binding cassette subfamily B multidrug efflux pump